MIMYRITLLVAFLVIFSSQASAQTGAPAGSAPPPPESPWSGNVSLGFLSTSGNTETTTYKTSFEIAYELDKWKHTLSGGSNGTEDTGESTAESYQLAWKSDYSFTERDYLFGLLNWNKDRFAGVVEQGSISAGYGRRVIDNPSHTLNLEIGAGYRDSDRSDGTNETSGIARGGLDYTWIWSETSGFDQKLNIEAGSDNTYIESVSAVRAKLVGDLNIVLSYTIKHNTDVPPGSEETDTLSAVSIEYAF